MLMVSGVVWRTSNPASRRRVAAASITWGSDWNPATVLALMLVIASNIETPPSDLGETCAKILVGIGAGFFRAGALRVVLGCTFFTMTEPPSSPRRVLCWSDLPKRTAAPRARRYP